MPLLPPDLGAPKARPPISANIDGGGAPDLWHINTFPGIRQTTKKWIPAGHYGSIDDLMRVLNDRLKSCAFSQLPEVDMASGFAEFSYDHRSEKVTFKLNADSPCHISVKVDVELYIKMGFGQLADQSVRHHWIKPPAEANARGFCEITGSQTADLQLGNTSIFLYSDIVGTRVIGNRIASLLAILPSQGVPHGQMCHYSPLTPEYCDLAFSEIDEIQIDLVNELGKIIKFQSGKVVLTLHLKDRLA